MGRRCTGCKQVSPDQALECLFCGRDALLPRDATERADASGAHPIGVAKPSERLRVDVPLAAVCGGEWEVGSVTIVTGRAGGGKSTEVARLARALGRGVAWLDAEMSPARALEVWARAGADPAELLTKRTLRIPSERFRSAVSEVTAAHRVVVIDSLDAWTKRTKQRGEEGRELVLKRARKWATQGRIVVVIAHYARKGHLRGTTTADHEAEAVIHVEPTKIWQEKCRWAPPCEVARQPFVNA